ncbi:uncharacterized protein MYCGRDRAFT_96751 [Zymoseptoria tritici IPO323]|uniref:Uncharacterized protein n=1 Tax=Zymoseptoria tritici (strain CBS 115943 / IPO323) TaxID=336722 RepID=F9XND9_ZYMTI|nr:uncharacterized protein MYCGRDRAFT_96751 [Zymoseptoria tritici IPO323]EGP83397.1 hypothetical protein MYCGRDRAFT_96751 [Zymoseptoria tritici IPO323]
MSHISSLLEMFSSFRITGHSWGPTYAEISESKRQERDANIAAIRQLSHVSPHELLPPDNTPAGVPENAQDFDEDLLSAMRRMCESTKTDMYQVRKRIAQAILNRTGGSTALFISDDFRDARELLEKDLSHDNGFMECLQDEPECEHAGGRPAQEHRANNTGESVPPQRMETSAIHAELADLHEEHSTSSGVIYYWTRHGFVAQRVKDLEEEVFGRGRHWNQFRQD